MPDAGGRDRRRLFDGALATTLAEQMEAEREAFVACTRSDDFREGVTASVEKRPATFRAT